MSGKAQRMMCCAVILGVLVVDQVIKVAVKTNMALHECRRVTDWFFIYFVENNGMAFGLEPVQKWMLTSFRIVAVVAIAVYLWRCIKKKVPLGYSICLSLILSGASGNIIDCLFYGLIWGEGSLLNGKVVDMFYFPLCEWVWPDWLPWVGGEHFVFFSPIFNFADAAISCGVVALLLFYHKRLSAVK